MVDALFPPTVCVCREIENDDIFNPLLLIHSFIYLEAWHLLFLLIVSSVASNNWQSAVSASLFRCRCVWECVYAHAYVYVPGRRQRHYTVLTGDEDFDNFRKKPFSDKHHHQFYVRSKFIHFIDFRDSAAATAVLLRYFWWRRAPKRCDDEMCMCAWLCVSVCVFEGNHRWKSMVEHTFSHRSYLISPQPVNDVKKSI